MNRPVSAGRKTDRTRDQIMSAFTRIVFAEGFDTVSVRRILADAGVARSTFYEYFSGKDDVLRTCMSRFLSVMAQCVRDDDEPADLSKVLDHLWGNRRLTDAIFTGSARRILALTLSEMIEIHLRSLSDGARPPLSSRLAAIQLAEGQLALVEAWLRGRAHSGVPELSRALHASSRASAKALLG